MPGFGLSQEPKDSWDLDNYIDLVIEFINKMNIKTINLIGHSNGGRIILKLMSRSNLDFNVNKIILIGSAGIVHKKTLKQIFKIKVYKICKKLFPKYVEKYKNKFESEDYRNASPILKQTMVKLINEDIRVHLPNIKSPTLLIWGQNDTATPIEDAKIIEKHIPDCGLVEIKNCSHYVFLEQPGYVNTIISTFFNGGN